MYTQTHSSLTHKFLFGILMLLGLVLPTFANKSLDVHAQPAEVPITASVILPNLKAPYDKDEQKVYWSGGPHEFANLQTQSKFKQGYGSGIDFDGSEDYDWCNKQCSFIVRSMAEGDVIYRQEGDFGKQVAVKLTVGGAVIIYGHLYDYFPGLVEGTHVYQGSSIGHSGTTNATNVHLHVELRDGNTCNTHCLSNGLGGNPVPWHSKVIDGYRIFEYRTSETDVADVFNYDGVAVKEATDVTEYYDFQFIDIDYTNYPPRPPINRQSVWTFLPSNVACSSSDTNCENSIDGIVQFSGHGEFGGGGRILSSNVDPDSGPTSTPTPSPTPPASQNGIELVSVSSHTVRPNEQFNPSVTIRLTSGYLDPS